MRYGWWGSARHENVAPVRMNAERLVDLAFGHEAELLVLVGY